MSFKNTDAGINAYLNRVDFQALFHGMEGGEELALTLLPGNEDLATMASALEYLELTRELAAIKAA